MISRRKLLQASAVSLAALSAGCQTTGGSVSTSQHRISRIIGVYSSQGIHRTGTEVDTLSGEWLASEILATGAQPLLEAFDFQRLSIKQAHLRLGDVTIPGVPLYDCLYTGPEGIQGQLGELGSDADVALVVAPPGLRNETVRRYMEARRKGPHRGMVVVTDPRMPADGIALINAEDFTEPFGPPVLQVASKNLDGLQTAAQAGRQLSLVAEAEYVDATAANIGAVVQGSEPDLAPVVVMTPRSGWWACASERGGGIAVFLEILRHLQQSPPRRSVLFTANTGHELGHTGLEYFLHQRKGLIKDAHCWLHLGANFAAAVNPNVRMQFSDSELRQLTFSLAGDLRPAVETPLEERPYGEARDIYDHGGRFVSILGGNGLFHHPADVYPDAVDVEAVAAWSDVLVRLVARLTA